MERYRRAGNMIEDEITLYDPEVFVQPVNAKMRFTLARETRPELRLPGPGHMAQRKR